MCEPVYFTDTNVRKQDMVFNSPTQEVKSNRAKANLMSFANDFTFIMEISRESKSTN